MEQRTFIASQSDCDYSGTHVYIEEYFDIQKPSISRKEAIKLRKKQFETNKNKNVRHEMDEKSSLLTNSLRSNTGTLLTWDDGYYLIEIYPPNIRTPNNNTLDVDIVVSMKNYRGSYITADEYLALVFYGIMCAIYTFFTLFWFS